MRSLSPLKLIAWQSPQVNKVKALWRWRGKVICMESRPMHVWLCHMTHWDWFRRHLHNARQHSLQVICMQGRWKVMQATWTEANFTCEFMTQAKIYFRRGGNKTLTINEVLLHQLSRCCVWKKYCNNTALDLKSRVQIEARHANEEDEHIS